MENYAIEIENLFIKYNQFSLNVDHLALEPGYVYGLVGKNGAGKTTLLKAIMNLNRHINDRITIFGKELAVDDIELKNNIGYVNDEFIYPGNMNAKQLARNVGVFYQNFDQDYFYQLLSRFGIDPSYKFKELSKGNKHKLMIAFVLAYKPKLLLLDEPTADIDPVARREILNLIYEIMDNQELTVIFSTHITSDLEHIADYIILIDHGRILFNNRKDHLEEEFQIVTMSDVGENIKPYLKGMKKISGGYQGLCINASQFYDNPLYQFKRASIEDIMVYLEQ